MNIELAHQIKFVRLHCLAAQAQHLRRGPHRLAFGKEFHNFALARGQSALLGYVVLAIPADWACFANCSGFANRFHHVFDLCGHLPRGTSRRYMHLRIRRGRFGADEFPQEQESCARRFARQQRFGVFPGKSKRRGFRDDHVWLRFARKAQALKGVARLADYPQIGFGLQPVPQAFSYKNVFMYEKTANDCTRNPD
jgi:hypothetical protein